MSNMREEFENWCAQNKANPNNYYFSEGWKTAWHARNAEIEALKAKHAELIEALRVIGSMALNRFTDDYVIAVGSRTPGNGAIGLHKAIETINAAIRGGVMLPDPIELMDQRIERHIDDYEEGVCQGCGKTVGEDFLTCAGIMGDGPALCWECLGVE